MENKKYIQELFKYLWEEKILFISGLVTMALTTLTFLLDPLIIAHIIDVCVPKKDVIDMLNWGFLFAGVIVVSGILSYFQIVWLSKMGVRVITKIKSRIFDQLMRLPVSYFDKNQVGELISRVESDSEKVKQLFSEFSVMILGNVMFFIGVLIVLFFKNWQITLALIIPSIFVLATVFFAVRYVSKFYRRSRELYADVTSVLTEYIQGMSIVQIFNRQQLVRNIIDTKSKEKKRIDTIASFIEYPLQGFYDFFLTTIFIVAVVYVMTPKIAAGVVSIGTLIIFIQYGNRIFFPLMMIAENINQIQRSFVSLKRIFELTHLKTEEEFRTEMYSPTFKDQIEFKDVWFKYKEDEWVLKNVNLTIKRGEKVALVGASGSGKSTTISLICGFYNIQKGQILVDGQDLNQVYLSEWRKKIGLVLQDIYLFPGNILENIRIYNDEIQEETVNRAIETVQAQDLVFKSNSGIHSEIKERGQNLSVGEKQLLSFARALVFNPEIIIMDEATASVDARTESRIQKAMDEVLTGRTAIIVAHRLASIVHCDKICLFQDGQIIAEGTHAELLEISPEYQKLVELQFMNHETAEEKDVANE